MDSTRTTVRAVGPKDSAVVEFTVDAPDRFPEQFLGAIAVEPVPRDSASALAVVERLATLICVEQTSLFEDILSSPPFWLAVILLVNVSLGWTVLLRRRWVESRAPVLAPSTKSF